MADIRQLLLEAFATERADHLAAMRAALGRAEDGQPIDLRELFRRAHSLKGAARAVEMPAIERVAHDMESWLAEVEAGNAALDQDLIARLRHALDQVEDGGTGAVASQPVPAPPPLEAGAVAALSRSLADLSDRIDASGESIEVLRNLTVDLAGLRASLGPGAASDGLARLQRQMAELRRRSDERQAGLKRALTALEADAERLMLVPAASNLAGLDRMVRDLGEAAGRPASLRIEGGEVEADRRVLEALRDPLRHLLRNAIAHGIEPAPARTAAGKPEQGRITLSHAVAAGRLAVTVADDGAGPDLAAIARRAGLPASTPPERLLGLVFEQGFSTRGKIDEVAGRGVGLSVVAEVVAALGGSVRMERASGGGTKVSIEVPVMLARTPMLLVEAGGEQLAIPTAPVRELRRIRPGDVQRLEGRALLSMGADQMPLPLASLSGLFGFHTEEELALAVVLEGSGGQRAALAIDALRAVRPLLASAPEGLAVRSPLVAGASIAGRELTLVLSAAALVAAAIAGEGQPAEPHGRPAPAVARTILVVDDSVTTRTLEKGILQAHGYKVRVAVDGLAGLETLREALGEIDLVIADVEMPRLDGFGLLSAIRNDPALANIPVIMMTSRDSPDDVRRGLDLGANAYVTKQEFDQGRLLATVARFF
jgi:two-component system, chemotaxis family, sensor kinase CheA